MNDIEITATDDNTSEIQRDPTARIAELEAKLDECLGFRSEDVIILKDRNEKIAALEAHIAELELEAAVQSRDHAEAKARISEMGIALAAYEHAERQAAHASAKRGEKIAALEAENQHLGNDLVERANEIASLREEIVMLRIRAEASSTLNEGGTNGNTRQPIDDLVQAIDPAVLRNAVRSIVDLNHLTMMTALNTSQRISAIWATWWSLSEAATRQERAV